MTSSFPSSNIAKSNSSTAPKPSAMYRGGQPARLRLSPKLRIAAEAGQAPLLAALCNAFIRYMLDDQDAEPFSVAWIAVGSGAEALGHVAARTADVAVSHHGVEGALALKRGVAEKVVEGWKEGWLLVGPKSNPAELVKDGEGDVYEQFAQIAQAAEETAGSARPVKFLSRYDKSASNVKESTLWATIGQTPWANPHSTWYHTYPSSAAEALQTAAALGQYTLTSSGTWFAADASLRSSLAVYASSSPAQQNDPLAHAAYVITGARASNADMATAFTTWLLRWNGGQKVIEESRTGVEGESVKIYSKPSTNSVNPFTPPQSPERGIWGRK